MDRKESLRDICMVHCYTKSEVMAVRGIGKNIRDLRVRKKMSQEDLAEKLYVSRQTVSNYETGRSRPDLEMLTRIAQELNVDFDSLLYGLPDIARKKKEWTKTFLGFAAALILFAASVCLDKKALYLKHTAYDPTLAYIVDILLKPLAWAVAGWTFFQAVSMYTRLRPTKAASASVLVIICWAIPGLYLLIMLPVLLSVIGKLALPSLWLSVAHFLLGATPGISNSVGYLLVSFGIGAIIWLSAPGQKDINTKNSTGKEYKK